MVLHQRTKQAFQAKDLSVAYSPCWTKLTEPFVSLTNEYPLVQAWISFVGDSKHEQETYGRTTAQQQAAAFKKLDQAVKAQKQKDDKIFNMPEFQKAFSQFIVYYYFASSKLASRKQIFALVQVLQPYFQLDETDPNGIIVSAIRSTIKNEIFTVEGAQSKIEIDMAWHQRALCLYTTLDYTMGRTALHADLDFILDQLSQLLHARVQTTNIEISMDHVPSEYTEATQDLEFILKLILAIISRIIESSNGSSTPQSNVYEISSTHNPQLYIIRILKDAITISSSPVYHRDVSLSSISGMVFANLIDLTSPTVEEAAHRIVSLVFGENGQDTTYLPEIPRSMIEMDYGWNTRLGENAGPGEEDIGLYMLGIVRGLLTNIRQEALVMPINNVSRWYASPVFHDLQREGLVLHQLLFHAIAYLCATSKDMSSKTFAFETMGHWLQQTKLHMSEKSLAPTAMKETLANCIDDAAQEKLTTYVLDYWEDPVDTVQHKVRTILELLLDIVYLKAKLRNEHSTPKYVTTLLERILMADSHRKSKHPILAILVDRVPIAEIISIRQDTLAQAILALEQLATAPGAAVAINTMVEKSWKECLQLDSLGVKALTPQIIDKSQRSAEPVVIPESTLRARKAAMQPWIDFWLKSVTQALTTDNDLIRKHLGHFIFAPLFSVCPEAFWTLFEVLNNKNNSLYQGYVCDEKYRFNAIVLAIKVARSLDLMDASNYADFTDNAATVDLIGKRKIDIAILHSAMFHASCDIRIDVLGILCESRRSTTPVASIEFELLKEFLPLNLNSVIPDFRQKLYSHLAKFLARVRGNCYVLAREIARFKTPIGKKNLTEQQVTEMSRERELKVEETKNFLEWLLSHIFSSIYPGASFQRVSTGLRLLGVIIKTFGIESTPLPPGSKPNEVSNFPFQLPIANESHTKILLGCLSNPFDHCREQALEILMTFKAPFTGYESKESVDSLVRWGLDWLKSTRAGESDSGGLVMKIVFIKYAIELGWDIQLPYPDSSGLTDVVLAKETGNPAVDFTIRLQNLLRIQIGKARSNQLDAAHHHPLHGSLIGLRYLFSSIDYASPLVTNHRPLWQAVHSDTMDLVEVVCGIVMGVLSNASPEGNVPATFTEMEESIDAVISSFGGEDLEESGGPNHQVILSYCWRAIKESASLMELVLSEATIGNNGILDPIILERAGGLFRRLLTTIRHPGAFSSVFPTYISLCTRLLNSEDASLAALPRAWLDEILDSILSDTISVTRRSAGLPLCILAIVNAELSDSRRTLLPLVMRRVMALAAKPVSPKANQQVDLPQIHAMNVLRRLFMDAKLSTAVLPYTGQGLELSIRAFSSHSWAVRNCGVMLFSTLLHRVFGAKRVRDEHKAINGITSRELFARLEGLKDFLRDQLEIAVSQLLSTDTSVDRVHPGLYPVLTLLSRLQPSLHADPADAVDGGMTAFSSLVRRCAASAIWKTREMAARALFPLVASRNLVDLVVDILQGCLKPKITQNETHGLLVQVQFLLRGHLLSEGVADRVVRRAFVSRFAEAFDPVAKNVLRHGCQPNRWMILSIFSEFVFGREWMGRDSIEAEDSTSSEMESEREEMIRMSDIHFKDIRTFIVGFAVGGILTEEKTYGQQIGGHLVRRSMCRIMISATVLGLNSVQSSPQASDMVVALLNDKDYEVRLETLEALQQLLETDRQGIFNNLDVGSIHNTLIRTLFKGEDNLECLRLEVAMITSLGGDRPFPQDAKVNIVEFWSGLLKKIEDEASGGVAVVEAILPAIGNVFVQIWNDSTVSETLRVDCLNHWSNAIHKFANEYQTQQLREAAQESITFFTDILLDPNQLQPSPERTQAYLKLFESLIWFLQDDEVDIREATALIVSRGTRLPYAVSSEKALVLLYNLQIKLFAARSSSTESQLKLLVDTLIAGLVGNEKSDRIVAESLRPSRVLFDKESPNLYREPLVSMQLTQRSLEQILAQYSSSSDSSLPQLPESIQKVFTSFHEQCIQQITQVQQTIEEWRRLQSENGNNHDQSPWGVSGRKPIFEVLFMLASANSLTDSKYNYLDVIHDSSRVHPAIVQASRFHKDSSPDRLFLIE